MKPAMRSPTRVAFSLIELLIVVAIIATLVGMSLPAIQRIRIAARVTQSRNNLKQISLAAHHFAEIKGFLPPNLGWDNPGGKSVTYGTAGSFFFHILPFIDNGTAFNSVGLSPYYDQQWDIFPGSHGKNAVKGVNGFYPWPAGDSHADWALNGYPWYCGAEAYRTWGPGAGSPSVKEYLAPSDPTLDNRFSGSSSYMANRELLSLRVPPNQISDGLTNTMMLAEAYSYCFDGNNPSSVQTRTNDWFNRSVELEDNNSPAINGRSNPNGYWYFEEKPDVASSAFAYGSFDTMFDFGIVVPVDASVYQGAFYSVKKQKWTFQVYRTTTTFLDAPDYDGRYNDSTSADITCDINLPNSLVHGAINVAMGDGSVRQISHNVSPNTWRAALTPDGNDVLGDDFWE